MLFSGSAEYRFSLVWPRELSLDKSPAWLGGSISETMGVITAPDVELRCLPYCDLRIKKR